MNIVRKLKIKTNPAGAHLSFIGARYKAETSCNKEPV